LEVKEKFINDKRLVEILLKSKSTIEKKYLIEIKKIIISLSPNK
jgi:hypothetical protein